MSETVCLFLNNDQKKKLYHLYNETNKEIYGFGVNQLRIDLLDNLIVIRGKHQRVPALKSLEERYAQLKQQVDYALFNEFKYRFRKRMIQEFNLNVTAVLRDYDTSSQFVCTVVVVGLEKEAEI